MAQLGLSYAGGAIGGAIGGPAGALVGKVIGGAIGAAVDTAVLSSLTPKPHIQGPRLTSVDITAGAEGTPITRLAGRSRLAGQMIWATRFQEVANETETGPKGGGGSSTEYTYYANFAVALCEGPVTRIGRIWADGRELDQVDGDVTIRTYLGGEMQAADSLIIDKEGAADAPAYRGIAYIVFEAMNLKDYGRRMPIITAEVYRSVGDVEPLVRGVALIPGTTEFGYDPKEVLRNASTAKYRVDNRHTLEAESDLMASLDQLQAVAPNCRTVMLVTAWLGTDLRAGTCEIKPKVENKTKFTFAPDYGGAYQWTVAGLTRANAAVVTTYQGGPAYGGSPNDASVIECIRELKRRGFTVVLLPFIMMDIATNNALPNPYSDNAATNGQSAYPWRGRITVSPAAGFAGTVDKTAAAKTQIDAFVGAAAVADFAGSSGSTVDYAGPAEWSYRRFILHFAKLAELAGGVDAFAIGSEMIGLTQARDGASYPFVDALVTLAADVKGLLASATITYAADWSEYHSHRPADGSGDVIFNLDPLWSDANIGAVAIDNYLPLSDWRDGTDHLDYSNTGPTSIYDLDYLKVGVEGGEWYDWYYATEADRDAQVRTPITDGAYSKPWVFRNKDIKAWWRNAHYDRPAGTQSASATGWVPESKPVWFTEIGCPAVDKGTNQPNVFYDPKSAESFFPHYSSGARDDAMQRAYLQALIEYWSDNANNPASSVYAGRMIDTDFINVWAWDARMAPSFPQDERAWTDGPNFETGHWISARFGSAPTREMITDLLDRYGFADYTVEPIPGVVDAVVIDRVMSARAVLEGVTPAYLIQAVESEGKLRFSSLVGSPVITDLLPDDLADQGTAGTPVERWRRMRGQESEIPAAIKLSYGEPTADDQPGEVEARRVGVASQRVGRIAVPAVMPESRARAIAETLLHDVWAARERVEFDLPPAQLAFDPGDVVRFDADDGNGPVTFRIAEIADGAARRVSLTRTDASLYAPAAMPRRTREPGVIPALGPPASVFFDGALLEDGDSPVAGYIAAYSDPWPGGTAFYRSPETTDYALDTILRRAAIMGELNADLYSGPVWRWDRVNELIVDLYSGALSSASDRKVLNGANRIAIENAAGEWEIVQFQTAELTAPNRYKLNLLLRGQRGSEHAMRDPVSAGARVLVLDDIGVRQPTLTADDVGLALNWRIGPASRDVSDSVYDARTVTLNGKGRRPLSPVSLTARWEADGDIQLAWIRRTRIGGDSWNQIEVPLAEDREEYEVEILSANGLSVVRTVTGLGAPAWAYTVGDQAVDFGTLQTAIRYRVYQISATYGRGIATEYP